MVKSNTTLPCVANIGVHATYANETLLLDGRLACRASQVLSPSKVEGTCAIA